MNNRTVLPPAQRQGLRDSVSERLLVAILDGTFQAGTRLAVQGLAKQLEVSATPVREATIELATLGFVDLPPNRGAICREFGPNELREIFHLRRILEAEAAAGACDSVPVDAIRKMKRQMQVLSETVETDSAWFENAMAIDVSFHKLIQDHCKNTRLGHEIERYNVLMRAIRRVVGNLYNVQLRAVSEHVHVLDALLNLDPKAARQRMAEHIDSTAAGVDKVMFGGSQNKRDDASSE